MCESAVYGNWYPRCARIPISAIISYIQNYKCYYISSYNANRTVVQELCVRESSQSVRKLCVYLYATTHKPHIMVSFANTLHTSLTTLKTDQSTDMKHANVMRSDLRTTIQVGTG